MLLFIILLQSFIFKHDVAMANFKIELSDDHLNLFIKMDKEDLENLYHKKEGKITDLTKKDEFVQKYLNENFYLVVNKQKINFKIQNLSKNDYFYNIELISQNKIKQVISHIQLKNTCLIAEKDKHSNVVNFHLNGKNRTFRLHKGRIRIDVKY